MFNCLTTLLLNSQFCLQKLFEFFFNCNFLLRMKKKTSLPLREYRLFQLISFLVDLFLLLVHYLQRKNLGESNTSKLILNNIWSLLYSITFETCKGLFFYLFQKMKTLEIWMKFVSREDWQPISSTYICKKTYLSQVLQEVGVA